MLVPIFNVLKKMYYKQMDYLWNECFDHISSKIKYIKFFEAIDKIKRELDSQECNKTHNKPEEVITEISNNNAVKVYKLWFNKRQLESTLFLDGFGSYFEYLTLRECQSLIYVY